MIRRASFFGLGLCGIHPCASRIKPVNDVIDVYLLPELRVGCRMNKGYD
jgi:hypothetical protein